jgi:hypothetical protein
MVYPLKPGSAISPIGEMNIDLALADFKVFAVFEI